MIFDLVIYEFRGPVIMGSKSSGLLIIFMIGHIEISDFYFVIFSNEDVLRLNIEVRYSVQMKVFKTGNKLSKHGSYQFDVELDLSGDNAVEVAKGSKFHKDEGGIELISFKGALLLGFNTVKFDYVLMIEEDES